MSETAKTRGYLKGQLGKSKKKGKKKKTQCLEIDQPPITLTPRGSHNTTNCMAYTKTSHGTTALRLHTSLHHIPMQKMHFLLHFYMRNILKVHF